MLRRMLIVLTVVLGASLILAACAPAPPPGPTTPPGPEPTTPPPEPTTPPAPGPVALTFVTRLAEAELTVLRDEVIPIWEDRTGNTVNIAEIPPQDVPTTLQAQQAAGAVEIDVIAQDNVALAPLVSLDLMEDLTPHQAQLPAEIYGYLTDQMTFDGKLMFVPYRGNVQIAYYNTAVFDELALEPPTTIEEYRDVCQALYDENGTGKCIFKGGGDQPLPLPTLLWEWIVSNGGDPMVLNDAGSVETFEFFQDMWNSGLLNQAATRDAKWDTSNESLARGDAHIMQNWPFGYSALPVDYGFTDFAVYGGWLSAHVMGGEVLGIPKGTEHLEEALDFIAFMTSKEAQEIFVSELSWPAVRDDALGLVATDQQELWNAIQAAARDGVLRPNVTYMTTDVFPLITEAWDRTVYDGEDVETVLNDVAARLEAVIAGQPVPTPPPAEAVELTFVTRLAEAELAVVRDEVIPIWEDRTGNTVNIAEIPPEDVPTSLQAQQAAGAVEIDVIAQDNVALAPLVSLDLMEDLTPYQAQLPAEIYGYLTDQMTFDGKLMFVPYRGNVQIAYYNTKVFDELGLEPPTTIEEYQAVCQALSDEYLTGKCIFKGGGDQPLPLPTLLWEWIITNGGDPMVLNDAGSIETFQWFQDMWNAGLLNKAATRDAKWDTSNESLARGDAHIMQNWPFGFSALPVEYGFTDFAVYGGWLSAHVMGGEVLGIPKGTENLEEALDFIAFMTSKEAQEIFVSELTWPAVRDDALGLVAADQQELWNATQAAARDGVLRPNVPYMTTDVFPLITEAWDRTVYDGEDVETVLNDVAARLAAVIAAEE
ncbi:MAG: extracellular solute-binding protein [Anaerolineae bacterium]